MTRRRLSLPTAAALAAFSLPVSAAPLCGAYDDLARRLEQRYGERPVARGLAATGALVEVLAAADGSTWTLLVIAPDGRACAAAAGENWRAQSPPPDPPA